MWLNIVRVLPIEVPVTTPWQRTGGEDQWPKTEEGNQGNRSLDVQLVRLIREANRILIFTGAGISTLMLEDKAPISQEEFLASPEARRAYWCSKREVWEQLRSVRPNAVHWAVVELERHRKLEMVVTQNIDGLHLWAGTSPSRVVELHGTDTELRCQTCGLRSDPAPHYARFQRDLTTPTCSECGGFLKHATGSVDESVHGAELTRAGTAAAAADLIISVGSTLDVYPSAALPLLAAQKGTPYVVINDGPTGHDTHPLVTIRLEGDVTTLFPAAVAVACRPSRSQLV
jgi:NAD-dependent deacetylase